jgi:hypothetical protein
MALWLIVAFMSGALALRVTRCTTEGLSIPVTSALSALGPACIGLRAPPSSVGFMAGAEVGASRW